MTTLLREKQMVARRQVMVSIVLADDHSMVRQGVRAILDAEPDFCVVGEAANGLEAAGLAVKLRPDVLVVDIMMPGMNGFDVTREVRKRSPETRIIMLSMHGTDAYVVEALDAGASGYVLKESSAGELVKAIREAVSGHTYLGAPLKREALEAYRQKSGMSIPDRL